MARCFISYPHGDPQEEHLASHVRDSFHQAGHECFLDVGMAAGTDWVAEIDDRLRSCDCFVLLLSRAAMFSEMVQSEVRLAHQLRQVTGKPQLLPVRLRYFGPLEYEMDRYLGALHFLRWNSSADSETVVGQLLNAVPKDASARSADRNTPLNSCIVDGDTTNEPDGRPSPSSNAATATVPGGTIRASDPYYVRRPEDAAVDHCAQQFGETVVIKGPRQVGKSSLLLRYLSKCQQAAKKVAFVDLSLFAEGELATYRTFLAQFADILAERLGLTMDRSNQFDSPATMTRYLERWLGQINSAVVIALDEADRIFGRPYQGDFFSMLRMWHNNRAPFPQWENVDLALAISTEPYLLIAESDRSPFNVGLVLDLSPFTTEHCEDLNRRYGNPLRPSEEATLYELLGGHPYLTRLAYYRLRGPIPMRFDELLAKAIDDRGPFGDHLRAILFKLHQTPKLLEGMRQVVTTGKVDDSDLYYRLYGAGLVRRENQRINPSNLLYARYFRDVL